MFPSLVVALALSSAPGPATCFARAYCSTGAAPKFILCSRGQDCTNARDRGMQFKADCTVSRWLGDAQQTRPYSVADGLLTIAPNDWEKSASPEKYRMSKDGQTLTSVTEPTHVYSTKACKGPR
ncbi:MAG: hypothetical protein ACK4N5_02960 [Myxococcales bacterium]